MENKYYGIKQAALLDKSEAPAAARKKRVRQNPPAFLLGGAETAVTQERQGRKPHRFLISLLVCAIFVGAYLLLGLIDNPVIQNILNTIHRALTFDLLGTDPSTCVINSWLASIF